MVNNISARDEGRRILLETVDQKIYEANKIFTKKLQNIIKNHELMKNPILQYSKDGNFTHQQMKRFHLEFYYAFAQVFTDTIIEGLRLTNQIEDRLGIKSKMAARFILQINLLDELGFKPGVGSDGGYYGSSQWSHYVQFFDTLSKLGSDEKEVKSWLPMTSAIACRATFQNTYNDYVLLTALLATAETVFHDFATPWALAVNHSTDIDVSQGYHSIHVENEKHESIEDGHSEDAWILFTHAATEDRFVEVEHYVNVCLNVWNDFCSDFLKQI